MRLMLNLVPFVCATNAQRRQPNCTRSVGPTQVNASRQRASINETHVMATVLAVLALRLHGGAITLWLLGAELALLATGFLVHQYLHGSDACQAWAISRLLADLARSVSAIGTVRASLDYLFTLPFPPAPRVPFARRSVQCVANWRTG